MTARRRVGCVFCPHAPEIGCITLPLPPPSNLPSTTFSILRSPVDELNQGRRYSALNSTGDAGANGTPDPNPNLTGDVYHTATPRPKKLQVRALQMKPVRCFATTFDTAASKSDNKSKEGLHAAMARHNNTKAPRKQTVNRANGRRTVFSSDCNNSSFVGARI